MVYVINTWISTQDIWLTVLCFVAFILAIYLAIVPHEIAHGLAAKWNGDLTAQVNKRLTMNPLAHFDMIGFAMLLLMGFGFAKPVPVNPNNFKKPRRGLFTVAIAGICYNFAAMIVFCMLTALMCFINASVEVNVYVFEFFYQFFYLGARINMMLFLFNIIPLGPLDGFKIIEAYVERDNKFVGFLRRYGTYILIGLFALHFAVNYIVEYAPNIQFLQYFDILGLYLHYGSFGIAGSVLSLFGLMFGLGPIGYLLF